MQKINLRGWNFQDLEKEEDPLLIPICDVFKFVVASQKIINI